LINIYYIMLLIYSSLGSVQFYVLKEVSYAYHVTCTYCNNNSDICIIACKPQPNPIPNPTL